LNSRFLNILGLSLLLAGSMMILNMFNITAFKNPSIAAVAMIFFSLYSTFSSKNIGRIYSFLNGVIFTIGVILFVISEYEILNTTSVFLPSFFVAMGTGSLMLFIENRKEKLFLITSLILFILGYFTISSLSENPLVIFANNVGISLIRYWPLIAIIFGVYYLLKMDRKKR
jgi:hypothetical protein